MMDRLQGRNFWLPLTLFINPVSFNVSGTSSFSSYKSILSQIMNKRVDVNPCESLAKNIKRLSHRDESNGKILTLTSKVVDGSQRERQEISNSLRRSWFDFHTAFTNYDCLASRFKSQAQSSFEKNLTHSVNKNQ